jgi:dTDP-4-amino-4,6-dideoxygalactose transaminase
MKKKSFIPYGRQWIDKYDIEAVVKVLESDWITQGPKVEEFEKSLSQYCGSKFAVVVSSGTAALHIACLAAGISKDDEVITSPITFLASANCILYCSGKPVFADVQKDTVNIDPGEIVKKITKRTKAIIPVHFAGHPADMGKIYKIANKYNLMIIEDACHALGARYKSNDKWIKVGKCSHSDMTVFSFHPVKSITVGEGGAILTNRRDLYEKLLMFRNHGVTKESSKFKFKNSILNGDWYYEMQELGFRN